MPDTIFHLQVECDVDEIADTSLVLETLDDGSFDLMALIIVGGGQELTKQLAQLAAHFFSLSVYTLNYCGGDKNNIFETKFEPIIF